VSRRLRLVRGYVKNHGKTIWVTGAGGFSGQHLLRFLQTLPEPPRVIGLDLKRGIVEGCSLYLEVDLTNAAAVHELARAHPPAAVVHLAGLLPPAPEAELWRVNAGGTLNLLQALAGLKRPGLRVLTVGSAAEYLPTTKARIRETDPAGGTTPYGRSKWAQSVLALAFGAQAGLEVMVARTFNLTGPGLPASLAPGALCAQFARPGQQIIRVGNLQPRRDFIDIRDAVSAYWKVCEKGEPGEIYNVCTGRTASIRTLVNLFSVCAGGHPTIQKDPARYRRGDVERVCGDNSKLRRLGWSPTISLEQSVPEMLAHARSREAS